MATLQNRMPNWQRLTKELPRIRRELMDRLAEAVIRRARAKMQAEGLVMSGKLIRSIRAKVKATELSIGSSRPYANIHNVGGSRIIKGHERRGAEGKIDSHKRTYRRVAYLTDEMAEAELRKLEPWFIRQVEKHLF